jgi:uncharacterized protein YndB with AHSA1/START domain
MSTGGGSATTSKVTGRELVIERTFDAPRELVFKVWTQPEHISKWFGPRGYTVPVFETDLRPGGVTRYCMRSTETGEESWGKSEFREVVPPERLVYTDWFADPQGNVLPDMPETQVTISFTDDAGKTRVQILTQFKSEADLESLAGTGMIEGWTETLDRLADYLPTAAA